MSTSIESATNINEWIQSIKIRSGIRSKVILHSSPCLQTLKVDFDSGKAFNIFLQTKSFEGEYPTQHQSIFWYERKRGAVWTPKGFSESEPISWRAFICKLVMACATNLIIQKDCRESLSAQKEHQRWRTHSVLVLMRAKENQIQVRNFWCINWMGEWKPRRSWAESWEFLIRRIDEMCKVIIF